MDTFTIEKTNQTSHQDQDNHQSFEQWFNSWRNSSVYRSFSIQMYRSGNADLRCLHFLIDSTLEGQDPDLNLPAITQVVRYMVPLYDLINGDLVECHDQDTYSAIIFFADGTSLYLEMGNYLDRSLLHHLDSTDNRLAHAEIDWVTRPLGDLFGPGTLHKTYGLRLQYGHILQALPRKRRNIATTPLHHASTFYTLVRELNDDLEFLQAVDLWFGNIAPGVSFSGYLLRNNWK